MRTRVHQPGTPTPRLALSHAGTTYREDGQAAQQRHFARNTMSLDDIRADFALLDDWEDKYRYVIELGKALPAFDEALRTPANKVRGCASQVWLATSWPPGENGTPALSMQGDSDAHIVRGLIAILMSIYASKSAGDILETDARATFAGLGLSDHLTAQRSNGLNSMVERIRADARTALASAET